jgi:hypothetical protein
MENQNFIQNTYFASHFAATWCLLSGAAAPFAPQPLPPQLCLLLTASTNRLSPSLLINYGVQLVLEVF